MPDHMALMTVSIPGLAPGIDSAAEVLGVSSDAVDPKFGVVAIDPARSLYAVQVLASALPADLSDDKPFRGPFANPRIEGFGPLKK